MQNQEGNSESLKTIKNPFDAWYHSMVSCGSGEGSAHNDFKK